MTPPVAHRNNTGENQALTWLSAIITPTKMTLSPTKTAGGRRCSSVPWSQELEKAIPMLWNYRSISCKSALAPVANGPVESTVPEVDGTERLTAPLGPAESTT